MGLDLMGYGTPVCLWVGDEPLHPVLSQATVVPVCLLQQPRALSLTSRVAVQGPSPQPLLWEPGWPQGTDLQEQQGEGGYQRLQLGASEAPCL